MAGLGKVGRRGWTGAANGSGRVGEQHDHVESAGCGYALHVARGGIRAGYSALRTNSASIVISMASETSGSPRLKPKALRCTVVVAEKPDTHWPW